MSARYTPSSRFVPAMNGIFANLPAARRREGRSGMTPSGPSMTGGKRNWPGISWSALCHAARTSSRLAFCAHGTDVPAASESAHPGRFAANVSHAGSRCDALKTGSVFAEPDSNICGNGRAKRVSTWATCVGGPGGLTAPRMSFSRPELRNRSAMDIAPALSPKMVTYRRAAR